VFLSTKLWYEEVSFAGPSVAEGSFGKVFKGEWRGVEVAVKRMKEQDELCSTNAVSKEMQREVDIISKLRHPNIVNFIGASWVPGHMFLVTEFIPLGSLGQYLTKDQPLKFRLKVKIALDCAKGMDFLHKCNFLHRDLKPDNLLVVSLSRNSPVNVKIADFGAARIVTEKIASTAKMTYGMGTPVYMAPEVLQRGAYSESSDVFAFAIVLHELLTQKPPYGESSVSWDVASFVIAGKRLEIPERCPPFYSDLISRCWAHQPGDRPSFANIVEELEGVLNKKWQFADSTFNLNESDGLDEQKKRSRGNSRENSKGNSKEGSREKKGDKSGQSKNNSREQNQFAEQQQQAQELPDIQLDIIELAPPSSPPAL